MKNSNEPPFYLSPPVMITLVALLLSLIGNYISAEASTFSTAEQLYDMFNIEKPESQSALTQVLQGLAVREGIQQFNNNSHLLLIENLSRTIPLTQQEVAERKQEVLASLRNISEIETLFSASTTSSNPEELFSSIDEWRHLQELHPSLESQLSSTEAKLSDQLSALDISLASLGDDFSQDRSDLQERLLFSVEYTDIGDLSSIPYPVLTYPHFLHQLKLEPASPLDESEPSEEPEPTSSSSLDEDDEQASTSSLEPEDDERSEESVLLDLTEEAVLDLNLTAYYRAQQLTPIITIFDGVVFLVRDNYIVVDHGAGIFTTYLNVGESLVKQQEHVYQNQSIGLAGNEGEVGINLTINTHRVDVTQLPFTSPYDDLEPRG